MENSLENKPTLKKTIVNYLVIIAMILMGYFAKAQSFGPNTDAFISASISQDLRFMTIGGKKRGYDAYTRDLLIKLKLNGFTWKSGKHRGILFIEYENADIEYGYNRLAVGFGVTFNSGTTKSFLFIPEIDWEIIPYAQFGGIDRGGKLRTNGAIGIEHLGRLSDTLFLTATHLLTERKDLGMIYGETKWKYSFYVGLELKLN